MEGIIVVIPPNVAHLDTFFGHIKGYTPLI